MQTASTRTIAPIFSRHQPIVTYEVVRLNDKEKENLIIKYGIHTTSFGMCVLGVAQHAVCFLSFIDISEKNDIEAIINKTWPKSSLRYDSQMTGSYIESMFGENNKSIHLLLKGTPFQIKVWEALLTIQRGTTVSYTQLAHKIGFPRAVRAVGSACGKNNIAYLIPCHRVLSASSQLGGYRWGIKKKKALLAYEAQNK